MMVIKTWVPGLKKLPWQQVDDNKNNLTWWTEKHNNYATRKAVDTLNIIYGFKKYDEVEPNIWGTQEQRKRWQQLMMNDECLILNELYQRKSGLVWHFLQGGWYRFLVDAKIYEINHRVGKDREKILEFLESEYGIEF